MVSLEQKDFLSLDYLLVYFYVTELFVLLSKLLQDG